jgi:hypothetical protein
MGRQNKESTITIESKQTINKEEGTTDKKYKGDEINFIKDCTPDFSILEFGNLNLFFIIFII